MTAAWIAAAWITLGVIALCAYNLAKHITRRNP